MILTDISLRQKFAYNKLSNKIIKDRLFYLTNKCVMFFKLLTFTDVRMLKMYYFLLLLYFYF